MQFLPAFALLLAVLVGMPFPLTTDLQATTIDDQSDRFLRRAIDLLSDRYRGVTSRQRGVIRARQVQAHQPQDGAEKPFGLAQRQMKQQPQRECSLDGNIGV
jgi:hypothetical protein